MGRFGQHNITAAVMANGLAPCVNYVIQPSVCVSGDKTDQMFVVFLIQIVKKK